MHKDIRKILDEMAEAGCSIVNGKKHCKVLSPRGRLLAVVPRGNDTGCWHQLKRLRARARELMPPQ